MKRKIILGLGVYAAVYLLAGAYVAHTIHESTDDLDRLITLHRVGILREDYLLQIKRVQADLLLEGTQDARSPAGIAAHVADMERLAGTCSGCHHSRQATERLAALKLQAGRYEEALSRLSATPPGARLAADEQVAFRRGEALSAQVRELIQLTSTRLEQRTRDAARDTARARHILYGLVAVGPLLSALLGFAFLSGLTRPVAVLVESTRRLKAGDLDHRVEGLTGDFRELAVSFNEMASSLKEQLQERQRTQQMVVVGELAAGLAHEIKNPLAGIKAAMQVLSQEAGLAEEDRRVLEKVAREVVRLESLMKDFLRFARPAKPRLTGLDVNGLVDMVLALYVRTAPVPERTPGLCIQKDLHPMPETMADPMQLQQVLLNLVLNAVEAMPRGGTLKLRTTFDAGADVIRIEVADTGRGISAEHADKIFQPFFTTKAEGTGLGLAISKRLVEQHGGSISVAENPAGGTIFGVHLPLHRSGALNASTTKAATA